MSFSSMDASFFLRLFLFFSVVLFEYDKNKPIIIARFSLWYNNSSMFLLKTVNNLPLLETISKKHPFSNKIA